MSLILKKVERPRELSWFQASSMLYGDWGTSKAYVLGIAFAIAGHASMFFLAAMAVLTSVIGYCYTLVCKAYPDGGGVYSAVRKRSESLSVIGALLLVADYVVTAALSSIEAFHYLGLAHPQLWAIGALVVIALINIFGPTKSGAIASVIALATVIMLVGLCAVVLPHIKDIQITLPEGPLLSNWTKFVGIVLALSGVEAIANVTGIMKEPVERTARRAIFPVMIEVVVISLILGAAMNAIPGLQGRTEDMIRAIGEHYVGGWFGKVIAVVMGLLLLSACNTAIMGLISVMFLMSKDKELPAIFSSLNRYGMPWFGLTVAAAVPVLVLIFEHEVTHLAALYAIGVVGAITINLGACSTNRDIHLKNHERTILLMASLVMLAVELTIMVQKHNALIFASIVLLVGLTARTLGKIAERVRVAVPPAEFAVNVLTIEEAKDLAPLYKGSALVAVKAVGARLVDEASRYAKDRGESVVYTLYVEEMPPGWAYPELVEPSKHAVEVLREAVSEFEKRGITAVPLWQLSDNAGMYIVKTLKELELDTVMIGATKRGKLERFMRGEVVKTITEHLPEEKHLVICT